MRSAAERYLFTCYSWLPLHANPGANGHLLGDELWGVYPHNTIASWKIARNEQNVVSPLLNYWDGGNGGKDMYGAIRDCNIFLENIHTVPDMEDFEKERWIGEVLFLKAYYHFWLMRMYGPIPLIRESLPITATIDEVRVSRAPFDEGIDYVVSLIDSAVAFLPDRIENESSERGRITRSIALSMKAYILVTAASPLFNGNTDYAGLVDENGQPLISQTYSTAKWQRAVEACREAIQHCHQQGIQLYYYDPPVNLRTLSDTTITQMSIRNSVCERWNTELIWGDVNSLLPQVQYSPRTWDPSRSHTALTGRYGPPIKIVELFYSKNGVPIEEDLEYDYAGRKQLQVSSSEDRFNIREGYTTVGLHFNREHRFYASLGFDGSVWYGQGKYDDRDPWYIFGKKGQAASVINIENHSSTGYWPKKLIHYQNIIEVSSYSTQWYPWPIMRLADLYLLYAEALNEVSGPEPEVYEYVNLVRARAGLPTVEDSWTRYSRQPTKFTHQDGMREIIHQERMIELIFEGQRYWDLRRWKKATEELNKPITGWSLLQEEPETYYREVTLFQQNFSLRNYLWPISERSTIVNKKLTQNPGW